MHSDHPDKTDHFNATRTVSPNATCLYSTDVVLRPFLVIFFVLAKQKRKKKGTHGKSQKEAGLANTGIADEDKLEEVVVVPLPAGGLGIGWGHRCRGLGRLWSKIRRVAPLRRAVALVQKIARVSIHVITTRESIE